MTAGELSVQDRWAPENRCFGCGAANDKGLRIKSFPAEGGAPGELVCTWTPEPHHEAFGNVLNGGIIGALLDCHSNWTAACWFMERDGLERPACTVTLDFHVKLKRPTPTGGPVHLRAKPVRPAEGEGAKKDRVTIEATLTADEKVTATCVGTFVAVQPGHPAYHRW